MQRGYGRRGRRGGWRRGKRYPQIAKLIVVPKSTLERVGAKEGRQKKRKANGKEVEAQMLKGMRARASARGIDQILCLQDTVARLAADQDEVALDRTCCATG